MKKFLIFLTIILVSFYGCKKHELEDLTPTPVDTTTQIQVNIYGKWILLDGAMYFRNLETNAWFKKAHFGPNRLVSSLRYSGIMFGIERIEKNVTVWEFKAPAYVPGTGEFILNYDYGHPLGFHVTANNWTIVEHPTAINANDMQLGGSSRPINVYVVSQNKIMIQIQEVCESINGYNHVYFSELLFEKISN